MALWTPEYIDTALWLDASDSATITLNGSSISQWSDKSGNSNHASQSTAAAQPALTAAGLAGMDVATFDGVDDYLALAAGVAITTNMTVAIVFGRATAGIYSQPMGGSVASAPPYPVQWWTDNITYAALGSGYTAHGAASTATGSFLAVTTRTASQQIVRRNGVQLGITQPAPSVGTNPLVYIGRRPPQYHKGVIAEIVLCAASEDVQRLEGYLAWKWGLQGSLPSGHPYYAAAPNAAPRILSELVQSWGDFTAISADLVQLWGLRFGADFSQRWSDAPIIKGQLHQHWGNAGLIKAQLVQRWQCMIRLKTIFHQAWSSPESLSTSLNQRYTLTEQKLRTVFDNSYDEIKNTGIVNTSLHQQYWVTGNTSVKTLSTQYLVVSGTVVYPLSIDIKSSIDQYAITASIELATYKDMQEFLSGVQVEVCGVLNENFVLIVDTYDYDLSFDSDTFKVDLISPAALLDSPFAALINSDYTGMASEICKILAGSITVYWNILDWYIGEGILSASEETPLSVIRKIVNAVGGVIQSLPDGSITIISRYPKSCNTWFSQPIVYSINYSEDVISEQFTLENAPGYNSFSIQDDNTSSTLLRVEVEEIDSNSKTIKVFVYPDVEPLVSHSGNTGTVSLNYTGYITENVDEEVEFVSGESSVDGPINGINYSSWKYSDLGSVTYEPTGVLYSAVTSESLLDISYKTGYYSYTVSTSVLENIQIIVEADV